jgi:hypothetical protein
MPTAEPGHTVTAREPSDSGAHEFRNEGRRQHMLDLAKSYERTADEMAPPALGSYLSQHQFYR